MEKNKTQKAKELNRIRGRIKAKLTSVKKFVESSSTVEEENKFILSCQQKLAIVEEIKQELEILFKNYLEIDEDETLSQKCDQEMLDIEEERNELEVSLKCLLSNYNVKENVIHNINDQNSNLNAYINHIQLKTKLPEIPLPLFYGKMEEFSNFKNQFMCLINDNTELTNDQKLFYLKAALRGEAKFIETSDDTFESLFAALEERFENKRAVVDIHIRNMLKLEKLNFESAKGLRNITDTINKSLRGLKSLNLECNDLTNAILVNIILERLDKESRKAYEMSIQSKQIPSLKELLQFLESRAMVLDQLGKYPTSNKFHKEFQGAINKPKNFLLNANKLSNVKPCILCKLEHPLQRCSEFLKLSVSKRIELLEKYNICKNCLKLHKPPCKSTFLCRSCQKSGHNSLIHLDPKLLSTRLAEVVTPQSGGATLCKQ
ncbi:hypothetical protein HNY73_005501 [Argiope bruennichi]|uniref:Uncharacterized protein n=1 Tax=Argiope bruennichi TaxID=94029 RepID=A0A8T0FGT2_ARGBR|nr:hypothetical protein HNY73_005501 [Argiope bruennichi]